MYLNFIFLKLTIYGNESNTFTQIVKAIVKKYEYYNNMYLCAVEFVVIIVRNFIIILEILYIYEYHYQVIINNPDLESINDGILTNN